ncbi:MAG: SciE type virulence protein [Acetobacteraceae bacterium]|nr:SciE type virulence protein [Acetobacteraceae bacterium]
MSEGGMDAAGLFHAGRLAESIEAAGAAVRRAPGDFGSRYLLAELLVFAGNLERADVLLDAAASLDTGANIAVAEFRQLLRAETARRQLHRDGRLPEFLDAPTPALEASLAAAVALRAADLVAARASAAEAEAVRPRAPGRHETAAFDDFRDADDMHAGFFEVLTTTGKYFWIPTERVERVTFHPPRRPRDLYWRRASLSVRAGPEGDVYMPALYPCEDQPCSDAVRLGRATEWIEQAGAPVRGLGQRIFLAGDEAIEAHALGTLEFDA